MTARLRLLRGLSWNPHVIWNWPNWLFKQLVWATSPTN